MTSNSNLITEEQFKASLPKGLEKGIPKKVLQDINDMIAQGEEGELFRENFMSHNHILKEGKFSIEQYMNAVKFISFRLLDNSQRKAYERTFPAKVTDWLANGKSEQEISSYVHAYNNTKLVVRLYDVTLVPFHLMHSPLRQEALLVEAKLMRGGIDPDTGKSVSHMVQHLAAKTVLEILTPPENLKTELELKARETEETSELKTALANLAKAQVVALQSGGNLKEIAESSIVTAEFEEVDEE